MSDNILKAIADNPALFDAVKQTILKEFDGSPRDLAAWNKDASNELLGQITRARVDGIRLVEDAFKEIAKHKSIPDAPAKRNEAR